MPTSFSDSALGSLQPIGHQPKRLTPLSRPPIPDETVRGLPDLGVILHPCICPLLPVLGLLSPLVMPGPQIASETEVLASVPLCNSLFVLDLVFPAV